MAATLISPQLKEPKPFKASPAASQTQPLVGGRCSSTALETSIPLWALERSTSTLAITIRLLGQQRFCLTPPAHKTQPTEQRRLNRMLPAAATRQMERSLSLATPEVSSTPPSAMKLSLTIVAVPATSH